MVLMIVLGLSGLCLFIGLDRRLSPGHLEGDSLKKQMSEATKLNIVSAIAGRSAWASRSCDLACPTMAA